jgi:hypothetical protein
MDIFPALTFQTRRLRFLPQTDGYNGRLRTTSFSVAVCNGDQTNEAPSNTNVLNPF